MSPTHLSPESLFDALQAMPACNGVVVGLSGGLDSVVLLHCLVQLRQQNRLSAPLRALHINHGLSARSGNWQVHCEQLCEQLQVPLNSYSLDLSAYSGAGGSDKPGGLENAARNQRYQAFARQLDVHEALLLAHHRDDQMETLLLRLMRGAGPRGLAGMPRLRAVGQGFVFRPLLDFNRRALQDYAEHHQLRWVDDESNADTGFDRNYCRHTLLPLVAARWPAYRDSWSKSAALQREADALLQDLARMDLALLQTPQRNELQLDALTQLSAARQRNVLRYWLDTFALPEPGWHDLHQLTEAIIPKALETNAAWHGENYRILSFKNRLVLLQARPDVDPTTNYRWNPLTEPVLALGDNGALHARPCRVDEQHLGLTLRDTLHVRYRQGGERCRLRGRPGKSLKKILQEQGIAPWQRERLPLVYAGDELLCVPDIGVSEQAATAAAPLHVITWQQPNWGPAARTRTAS